MWQAVTTLSYCICCIPPCDGVQYHVHGHKNEGPLCCEPRSVRGSPLRSEMGQNTTLHAVPAARFLFYLFVFSFHSTSFFIFFFPKFSSYIMLCDKEKCRLLVGPVIGCIALSFVLITVISALRLAASDTKNNNPPWRGRANQSCICAVCQYSSQCGARLPSQGPSQFLHGFYRIHGNRDGDLLPPRQHPGPPQHQDSHFSQVQAQVLSEQAFYQVFAQILSHRICHAHCFGVVVF